MATERTVKIKVEAEGQAINDLLQEIDQLKDKIKTASDPKVVKKLNDEFEETTRKLKGVEKATKEMTLNKTFEEVHGNILPLSGRLGELEDRMYELALAGKADTQEFKDMNEKAAKYRTTIKDVDRQVDMLADNKGMSVFSAGADEVGSSLLRMDFETAALQASSLAKASGKISLKSATKSVKNLGKTFLSLGKALFKNPFFLIVGVVALIVAAIVGLMDELGILQKIFDAVGDAIGWVIQQFKDLLDWIGLTTYAAEDAAQRHADAMKKKADAQEESSNRIVAALDHEIRMMEADGEVSDKEFEKILEHEAEKRNQLFLTAEARAKEAFAALKAAELKGDLDEEEMQDLRDKFQEQRKLTIAAQRNIEAGDIEAQARRKARRDQNAAEEKSANDKEVQDEKDTAAEKQAIYKEYRQNRLDAQRQTQDLTLELMSEGVDKELAEAKTKYDRLIEDTKANEKLNQEEKTKIVEQYTKLRNQKIAAINAESDAQKEAKAQALRDRKIESDLAEEQIAIAAVDKLEAQNERIRELRASDLENKISSIKSEYAIQLDAAKGNADLIVELEKAKANEIKDIRDQALREEIQNQRDAVNFAVDQTGALFAKMGGLAEEGSAASKAFALASIISDTASALMKAVPVALEAAKATGPAAPIVFAGTLAGIIGTVVGAAANAKKALTSGGGGAGGVSGGGSSVSAGSAPNVGSPKQTPEVSPFNDNEDTNQNAGGSVKRQVMVVDYTDIKDKGNEVNGLQNRVKLA